MGRPSPLPPVRRLRDFSARQNRSKTYGSSSGVMPVPVSVTSMRISSPSWRAVRVTVPCGRGVPERVGDQVAERLPHPDRIGVEPRCPVDVGAQFDAGRVGGDVVGRGDLVEEFVAAHGFAVQAQGAGVGVREVPQVVDDALEDDGLLVQRGQQGGVRVDDSVAGDLQPAADIGERAAQFVGDVADHGLALGFQAFAAFGQVVEGRGQDAGLVPGGDGDADMAVRGLLGRRGQRAQRPYQPGGDHGGHGHGDGEHEPRGAHDLGLVARGHVEPHGWAAPAAKEQLGHRRRIGVELGATGFVEAGLGLLHVLDTRLVVAGREGRALERRAGLGVPEGQGQPGIHARPGQTAAGERVELGQCLLFRAGRRVQQAVGALVRHIGGLARTVRVGHDRATARRAGQGGLHAVAGEAALSFPGQEVELRAFRRGEPVRADHARVGAAALGAPLGGGVGAQRVHGRGGGRWQGGAGRRRVGDGPPVGGGQGDTPTRLRRQLPHGRGDSTPVAMGGRVAAELGQDLHVRGEGLALFLSQRAGGGRHGQPCGRRHRAHGDEAGGDQQPHQEALAQRDALAHQRPPLSL